MLTFRGIGWFRLTRSGFVPIDLRSDWPGPRIVMRDWRTLQRAARFP